MTRLDLQAILSCRLFLNLDLDGLVAVLQGMYYSTRGYCSRHSRLGPSWAQHLSILRYCHVIANNDESSIIQPLFWASCTILAVSIWFLVSNLLLSAPSHMRFNHSCQFGQKPQLQNPNTVWGIPIWFLVLVSCKISCWGMILSVLFVLINPFLVCFINFFK